MIISQKPELIFGIHHKNNSAYEAKMDEFISELNSVANKYPMLIGSTFYFSAKKGMVIFNDNK